MASASPVSFGALLRRLRTQAGLTQEALAAASGVGVRTISDLERGLADRPRAATLAQLVAALQLSPEAQAALEAAARQLRRAGTPAPSLAAGLAADARARRGLLAPPLVGRAVELAAIERVLAGQPQPPVALFVAGEPGIGKSRLLAEAARRGQAQGWMVLAGGCTRRSGQEPYAPLLDAFARCLAALPTAATAAALRPVLDGCAWLVRLLPELAERTLAPTPVPAWTLPPEQERRLMYAAAGRFLANVAGPAGTLLVLDDLQWAGEDALDLLGALLRGAPAGSEPPLCVLGAYRATEVPAAHPLVALLADLAREGWAAPPLTLGPLAPDAARELVASLLTAEASTPEQAQVAAQVTERLLARGGGVPFFLISCAQAASQGDAGAGDPELPWTVQQSLRQRVGALAEPAPALLGLAAVAGRELPRRPLLAAAEEVLGVERAVLLAALDLACRAALLMEDERGDYLFAHDLIREVVLADLGAARRAAWHLAWAEALERRPEGERERRAAELALHFARGGETLRALPYLERAGELAQARYANSEAEVIYRELLRHYEELGRPLDAARTAERLGTVLVTVARDDEAIAPLSRAAGAYRDAGDVDSYAHAMALVGRAYGRSGGIDAGILSLESVAQALDPDPPSPSAIAIHAGLTMLYWSAARYREQASAAQRALEVARTLANDREAVAWAESLYHAALLMLGHLTQNVSPLESALPTIEAGGDGDTLGWILVHLGESYACLGRFDRVLFHMVHAGEVAELMGNPLNISYVCYWRGLHAFYTGDWQRAHEYFEHGRIVAQPVATAEVSGSAAGYALLGLGQLSCARGEDERGGRYLEEALALARHGLPPRLLRPVQGCLAERDLLAGRHSNALVRLGPLLEAPEGQGREGIDATPLLPLLAWAHLAASDLRRAEEVTAEALDRCRREQHQLALLDALRIRALLDIHQGRWDEAAAALDAALAVARPMPYPYAEARALFVYGQLHAAKSEPERARAQFEQALAILDRLGERLYAEHIAQALGALGT